MIKCLNEELIKEAWQLFPGAQNDAHALGLLSLNVFEKITKLPATHPDFSKLSEEYFLIREAYEYESKKLINSGSSISSLLPLGKGQGVRL